MSQKRDFDTIDLSAPTLNVRGAIRKIAPNGGVAKMSVKTKKLKAPW